MKQGHPATQGRLIAVIDLINDILEAAGMEPEPAHADEDGE